MSAPSAVIFMTSNGVGMGHLSRQLTLALSGPQRFRSTIFSLSGALPRVMAADTSGELPEAHERGVRYEYCPSRESGWLPPDGWRRALRQRYRSYRWHPYLRDRLVALAAETNASAVVFDGVVPYEGILQARSLLPGVSFVWVRRGMWRPDAATHRLTHAKDFDLVIEPGDFGSAKDQGPLADRRDALHVAPVSLVDVLKANTRETARAELGLPSDRPVLLLAPGSGALGSIEETATRIQREIAARGPEWVVAVTRQSIVQHRVGESSASLVVLDDIYPLARHLAAFDAAVSAAGYNAVHELLATGIPTLLVPSIHHVTDDQAARAAGVAARGAALVPTQDRIERAVADLLEAPVREELSAGCADLEPADGGLMAADLVADLAQASASVTAPHDPPSPPRPWVDARTPVTDHGERELRFSEQITVADVRGAQPVEHLLSGSSTSYRATRQRIASWLYAPARNPAR